MKRLTLLLFVCAFPAAQFAQAADQSSLAAIRSACAGDAQKLCVGVQPGGGRIVACLKEHKDSLSEQCKQAAGLSVNSSSSSAPSAASTGAGLSAGTSQSKAATAPKATSAKATPATGPEKFKERAITDTDHGGMRAATVHLPEKWRFENKIEWHYGWVEYPLSFSSHSENPDNSEAYFNYPLLRFDYTELTAQLRQYDKGAKIWA